MNRIARSILLASVVCCVPAVHAVSGAQGPARPTVAILYFNNNVFTKDARDYDGLSKGIPDFLVTELAANPAVRVIERDQVQKLLDEQKLVTKGQIDRETAVKLGKLLGAQHMIFGGFMADQRGNFRIDARAVNVETSLIEYTDRVQDKSDNVMTLIAQLAEKLNAGMKLPAMPMRGAVVAPDAERVAAAKDRTAPVRAAPGAAPTRLPMRYAVMYGKALDLADKGETARAVELFGAVLRDFPDFAPARNEVGKLKSRS